MKQKKYKKSSIVGRRTGVHIVALNKTLKLNENGFESFGDYWPSSGSSRDGSLAYMNSSPFNPDVKRISSFVKNIIGEKRESISFINPSKSPFLDKQSNAEFAYPHLVTSKPQKRRKPYTKGRRTGADVISGKEILVNENMEDFKGYWTATKSNFDTEINGTDTDKVSISESRSCRSDFNTDTTSKILRKCSYPTSLKERSFVKAVRADSTYSPTPSNLNSPKNLTLRNFKTFKASNSDSIANSEVTSTTVDGNKFKGLCNMVTPAAVRRHSPKISPLSKNDVTVNLHETIAKRIPFLEVSQSSVSDFKSINSDNENINDEIPKKQDYKFRNVELKKTGVKKCEIQSEFNQNSLNEENINQNMETQKTKNSTFRTTNQKIIRVKNCEMQTVSSNKLFSKLETKYRNENGNCKNYLSTTRNRIETNCMSSSDLKNHETHFDSNRTISNDEAESTKEKTKHSQAQKEQTFSLSSSVSFHNNEMNKTQTLLNYMPIVDLPEAVHSNQIENLQRSTKSKSQTRKNKVNLSTSKNRDKSDSICFPSRTEKQKKKNSLVIEKGKIHSHVSNTTYSQDEAEENSNKKHTMRKHKGNLSTSRNRDEFDSISFAFQTKKQKKTNSSVIKSDKIPSLASNHIYSQDEAAENTNKNTKFSETRKEEMISLHNNEMTGIQTPVNNMSSRNSHEALHSYQTSKDPKSTGYKSRRKKSKNNLSRNRVETDCLSSLVIENDVESTNKETKQSEPKKQEISSPTCLSLQNNEKTLTQTLVNKMFKINSPEAVHLSQIARTQKSAESKSRTGKSKYDLSTSRKIHEIDRETTFLSQNKTIDKPVSKALLKANKSKQRKRKSDSNLNSKSKKRKSDNIETKNNCSQMPALRRSKRDRIAPLESWRLERRVFGYKDGEVVSLGYVKGFDEEQRDIDKVKKPKIIKKQSQRKNLKLSENSVNKELIQKNIEKVSCTNPYTGEEELLNLHRPYDTLLWSVPSAQDETDPSYSLSKSQSSELISFGYIEIGVKKKKDTQYSPTDNINLTVFHGKVKVSINNIKLKLTEKDTITVPSGNGYSIKNTGKIPAMLGYCTFKVPFFDYQFGEYSATA